MSAAFDLGLLVFSLAFVSIVLLFSLSDYFLFVPIFAFLSFFASLAVLKGEQIALRQEKGIFLRLLGFTNTVYWAWVISFMLLFSFSLFYGDSLRLVLDDVLPILLFSSFAGSAVVFKSDLLLSSITSPKTVLWSDVIPEDSFTLQFTHRFLALVFSFVAFFVPAGVLLWALSLAGVLIPLDGIIPLLSFATAITTIYLFGRDKSERLQIGMRKIYLADLLHNKVTSEMRVDFVKTAKLRRISDSDECFVEFTDVDGWRFVSKLKDVRGFQAACAENNLRIN
ncbi:hypothetical protein HY992_03365 [Candidatus Micrarchaeota archaeon]|nr:hypothetical protein [Candidatus Micrarchaeota archaeon]